MSQVTGAEPAAPLSSLELFDKAHESNSLTKIEGSDGDTK